MLRNCSSGCSDSRGARPASCTRLDTPPARRERRMNTRHIWMGTAAIVVAFSGGVAAQSTISAGRLLQQSKDITVTGCVQLADRPTSSPTGSTSPGTSAGARPGTSNAPSSAASTANNRFMLTGATSGGSANATRSDSPPAADTYLLEGQTAELRQHLNHKVEITGHVSSSYSSSGSSSSSASGRRLNVQSVRMIAASCAR